MLFFDIETDGLMESVSKVHCIAVGTIGCDSPRVYGPDQLEDALLLLGQADVLVGHNAINYDVPVLRKLYPQWEPRGKVLDTICLARLVYSNLERDESIRCKPGVRPGSHSLENWGKRLGCLKGDYGKQENAWDIFTPEMATYCAQDVKVTMKLYEHLMSKGPTQESIDLEMQFATIIQRQVAYGFPFHTDKAEDLYAELCVERSAAALALKQMVKGWYKKDTEFVPKVNSKKYGYRKGCPCTKIKWVEFNPASRPQIGQVLIRRGWKPKKFTPCGQPQIDEKAIGHLKYPEVPHILRYLELDKHIGMLAEGKQAWLKRVKDGRIHGDVNTNGAVTGRCTHSNPNLGQVPSDHRFRELFHPGEGRVQVGCDASGLELRCLAHYMGDEEYTNEVLSGDIHTKNQLALGVATRAEAKGFIYPWLYGAGDALLGAVVGGGKAAGKKLREKFLEGTPALKKLVARVKSAAARGHLIGLDGRRLPVRSEHAALNVLLQAAGAVVMKKALCILDDRLKAAGVDYEFIANVHDEYQLSVAPKDVDAVSTMAVQAIRDAGEHFKFRCPLDGEAKVGNNWSETH